MALPLPAFFACLDFFEAFFAALLALAFLFCDLAFVLAAFFLAFATFALAALCACTHPRARVNMRRETRVRQVACTLTRLALDLALAALTCARSFSLARCSFAFSLALRAYERARNHDVQATRVAGTPSGTHLLCRLLVALLLQLLLLLLGVALLLLGAELLLLLGRARLRPRRSQAPPPLDDAATVPSFRATGALLRPAGPRLGLRSLRARAETHSA